MTQEDRFLLDKNRFALHDMQLRLSQQHQLLSLDGSLHREQQCTFILSLIMDSTFPGSLLMILIEAVFCLRLSSPSAPHHQPDRSSAPINSGKKFCQQVQRFCQPWASAPHHSILTACSQATRPALHGIAVPQSTAFFS